MDGTNGTATITAGKKDGSAAGGKITGSHDGISYYYTEIDPSKNFELSADIKVNFFAKTTPDNQEAFGIMARDAIGVNGDTTVFPSNMVMIGGYRGLIQSVFRNNVNDSTGAGAVMEDVTKFDDRPANDGSTTYRMTLKKTNTGYQVSVNNGKEKIYYRPKQLEVLNPNKIYVGFFAARVASITVSNISMKTSDVATDPAGLPEPPAPVPPAVSVASLGYSSTSDYNLNVLTNSKGTLQIKEAGTEIYNGPVEGNKNFALSTTLVKGNNAFDVTFTPNADENVTSIDPIRKTMVVTYKTYGEEGGAVYVSPAGTENGAATEINPIDIYSAVKFLRAGQTIYARGGNYNLTSPINIDRGNSGTADKLKVLSAYPNERPVFDFGKISQGLALNGDYWKVYEVDVTNASSTGFRVAGNHNVVELVNTYANGDTGLQISGSANESKDMWPSYNLILNCTSYDNRDASENNADGFAAKLTTGRGNVFRGCIAHNNTDDGWDLYSKLETGPIEPVVIEESIAYGNGTLTNGYKTKGDGNGFKMGGEGLSVKHVLRNSLAFGNNANGVTSNSDPAIIVENTTSVDNGRANFSFAYYINATPQFGARDNISFRTVPGEKDSFPAYLASEDNFFYNGTATVNSSGKELTAANFISVVKPATIERSTDGSIIFGNYMVLDTEAPAWTSGTLNASNVTLDSLKLAWNEAADNAAVTSYRVYQGSTLLAEVAADVKSLDVNGLNSGTSYTFTVQAGDAAGNWSINGPSVTVTTLIPANTDIDPGIINLKSSGRWITGYVELFQGFDVSKIDASTVKMIVNGVEIQAEAGTTSIGNYDKDSLVDLMVKFDRVKVAAVLAENTSGEASVTIIGKLQNGISFIGSAKVKVIK